MEEDKLAILLRENVENESDENGLNGEEEEENENGDEAPGNRDEYTGNGEEDTENGEGEKETEIEDEDEDLIGRYEYEIEEEVADFVDEKRRERRVIPASSDEEEDELVVRKRRMDKKKGNILDLGTRFYTGYEFKQAVLDYALSKGRNVKQDRWDKTKLSYRCGIGGNCKWKVYCSYDKPSRKWVIKTRYASHSCSRNGKCKLLKGPVITSLFLDKLRQKLNLMPEAIHSECCL